jgi:ABC transporter substrate binding protein
LGSRCTQTISNNVAALQRVTHIVPIVFAVVIGPVGAGFVASLARPGGNTTGFSAFEYSLSGKWLELVKELAPSVTRIAFLRDPAVVAGIGQFAAIQAMAPPSLGMERPIDVRDPVEIERGITALASEPNAGLIVTASPQVVTHRDLIIALPSSERLPVPVLAGWWWPRLVWAKSNRQLQTCRRLRRSRPQGCKACRPAGAGAEQIRACDQSKYCQRARPDNCTLFAHHRRRGDRIDAALAALAHSRFRPFSTFAATQRYVWSWVNSRHSADTAHV